MDIREDFFGQISTTTLVNNQDEYILPSDLYKMQRLEINYIDTSSATSITDQDWRIATETDVAPISTEWETLRETQPTSLPVFNLYDQSLFIAPTFNLTSSQIQTNGVKLWYIAQTVDFVAGTDVVPFPYSLFYMLLVYRNASDYYENNGLDQDADRMLQKYRDELKDMVRELKQENLSPVKTNLPFDDGSQY